MALRQPTVTVRLDANTRGFQASIDRAARDAEGFGRKLGRVGKVAALGLAGLGAAGVAAGAKLAGAYLDAGRELNELAQISKGSAEQLQVLGRIAERGGGSAEDVADAYREMQLRLAELSKLGSGPAADALNIVGLSLESLQGLSPDEQFLRLRDAIAAVEDPADRLFAAEELLGGSSERLQSVLSGTSSDFAALAGQVRAAGGIMSDQAVAATAQLDQQLQDLKAFGLDLVQDAMKAIVPVILDVIEWVKGAIDVIGTSAESGTLSQVSAGIADLWTGTLQPALRVVADFIDDRVVPVVRFLAAVIQAYIQASVEFWRERMDFLVTALRAAWDIIKQVFETAFAVLKAAWDVFAGIFTGDWERVWGAVKDAFAAVWDLVTTIFGAGLEVLQGLWAEFGEIFGHALDAIKTKFTDIWESIYAFFQGVVNRIIGAIEAVPNAFASGMNALIRAWNDFSIRTPEVKVLGRVVVPSIGWDTPNIATIPHISLPRLAEGGIVTRPTVALVGEAGPEAVIPLGRGAATVNVYLQGPIIGNDPGGSIVDALEEWARRNGPLPTTVLGR